MTGNVFYLNWEPVLMEWMQRDMGKVSIWIASIVTALGEETALILVLGYIYWCYDKKMAKFLGTNIVVGLIVNPMLKNVVFRTRPYMNHGGIKCLRPVDASANIYNISAQGYSFPSGHATNASTVFGTIAAYKKRKFFVFIGVIIPLAVGISRVALGVHYPTDVLAGWISGCAIVILITWIQGKVENKNLLHLCIFLLALPGCLYCKTNDYFTALGTMAGFFLAIPFEERFVKFEGTKSISFSILRILGGIAVYLIINKLLKLPFSKEFLDSSLWTAYAVRTVRYAVVIFCMLAVYPVCFKIKIKRRELW